MAHTEANADSFKKEVLEAAGLVLVDFWAPWCGPCRMLGPVVEEISESPKYKSQLKVVKVDVDENGQLAQDYDISSIPAVKFFHAGKVVSEFVGVREQDDLEKIIDEVLATLPKADAANKDSVTPKDNIIQFKPREDKGKMAA